MGEEDPQIRIQPIQSENVSTVAAFLHTELNATVSKATWSKAMTPPWSAASPNHGFMLVAGGEIVGVHLAFYSERQIEGSTEQFCNLGAWCVLDEYRSHGLRLLRALLAQREYTFTDLSPSGNVIDINRRLRFQDFDTRTVLLPNRPALPRSRVEITADPSRLEATLDGDDLRLYHDHQCAGAARHMLIKRDTDYAYVVYRRDRRKGLAVFGSILYTSNAALLKECLPQLCWRLFIQDHLLATLVEMRLVGRPRWSRVVPNTRLKMFKSRSLNEDQIDYLYSELTCVPW